MVEAPATAVGLTWSGVRDAQSYDVELNGFVVARSNQSSQFEIAHGDGRTGLSGGANSVRVRGRAGELEGPWSEPQTFVVKPSMVIRSRGFDAEDDGDIALDHRSHRCRLRHRAASRRAVRLRRARQGPLACVCSDASNTKAYKNHDILPIGACWIRLSFSPRSADGANKRVQLARINDSANDRSERLMWITGKGITSTSVKVEVPVPDEAWVQLQLGVDADGKVELWAFDGMRETLVGTGKSELIGTTKDRVSIGNHNPNIGVTFEAWMDDFEVGETRLPWLRADDPRALRRPKPLVAAELPPSFSFVFGSCTNSNHVPATGTALAAAADANPDFVLHLGDFGYLDSSAYAQSTNGYIASWSDLLAGDHMARLADKPWIFMCSDHDLGGNNIVAQTAAPFAADAFAQYHSNDPAADGVGRYGSVTFDDGRVLLIWTEGVLFRSPLDDPFAPGNTKLGPEQKAWLLDLLATTTAQLVMIATETTVAHVSKTSWSNHPDERREVLDAATACPAQVRFLSGDLHRARWALLAENVVEWGAAAMSEFPEGDPAPVDDVIDSSMPDFHGYRSRPSALEAMTLPDFNAATTFGHAAFDTAAHSVTFELRANDGSVRIDERGQPMAETFVYA